MTIISKRKTHITMAVLFVFLTFLDQLTKKIASMYLIGNDIWKIKELPGGFFKIAPGFSEVFLY